MSPLCLTTLTLVLALSLVRVHSLSVVPGSPCFDTCNGGTATSQGDIVCTDNDFTSTDAGTTLSTCLTCLHGSSFRNGFVADSNLFLYYLSSIQQSCLGNSDVTSSCSAYCSSLSASFSNLGGRNQFQSPFSYCSANGNAYFNSASDCAACLQLSQGSVILGNVVYVAELGCQTTPSVQDGEPVSYPGNLFGTTAIGSQPFSSNIASSTRATSKSTSKSSTTSIVSTSDVPTSTSSTTLPGSVTVVLTATLAFTPSSTASPTSSSAEQTASASLSRGLAAGIGIALGIIGIAAIIAFAIILRRRLKRKSVQFQRMSSPAMMEQSPVPPAAGVFLPPIHTTSTTSLGTVAAGVLAKAGLGQNRSNHSIAEDIEAVRSLPQHRHSKSLMSMTSRSFKSMTTRSWRSRNMTPRTSAWFYAANPKKSSDLTALPQPAIVPGMNGIPEVPPSRGTLGRSWE